MYDKQQSDFSIVVLKPRMTAGAAAGRVCGAKGEERVETASEKGLRYSVSATKLYQEDALRATIKLSVYKGSYPPTKA